ncbi:MAG TPA: CPBP family intramembrane glutamic endopeptidase [Terriglobales bacterium]|nr:CPBP family intramembrane glutamic endopeptidase [Terriglobales bacterium]
MSNNGNLNPEFSTPNDAQPAATQQSVIRKIFFGPNGLRAGWRFAIYVALSFVLGYVFRYLRQAVYPLPKRVPGEGLEPVREIIVRGSGFLVAAVAAWIMARIEREKWEHYGLPVRRVFSLDSFVGLVWGFVALTFVMGGLWLAGAYRIEGLALSGGAIWKFAALWGVMFLIVGLLEEFTLRGYPLYTLASGMGFWPAAILTSGLFVAAHLGNPGETWMGLTDVFLIGVFLCLTLWRTGDLWFAVMFHASWDWGLTYFYSVPNSGATATGHLFNVQVQGPKWLSGGSAGPEGSIINLFFDLLGFVVFLAFYRHRKWVGMNDRRKTVQTSASVTLDASALTGNS